MKVIVINEELDCPIHRRSWTLEFISSAPLPQSEAEFSARKYEWYVNEASTFKLSISLFDSP